MIKIMNLDGLEFKVVFQFIICRDLDNKLLCKMSLRIDFLFLFS